MKMARECQFKLFIVDKSWISSLITKILEENSVHSSKYLYTFRCLDIFKIDTWTPNGYSCFFVDIKNVSKESNVVEI